MSHNLAEIYSSLFLDYIYLHDLISHKTETLTFAVKENQTSVYLMFQNSQDLKYVISIGNNV